jgi:nucleotide-binding universal stress UspA family protein
MTHRRSIDPWLHLLKNDLIGDDIMKCTPTKCTIERILIGIDGSENSLRAATLAGEMAATFGAHVTLLHVHSSMKLASPSTDLNLTCDIDDDDQSVLCDAINVMNDLKILYDTKVVIGNPGEMILKLAEGDGEEKAFDLIVLGSNGKTMRERFTIGSVSRRVSHNSKVPVLVVP